MQRRRPPGWVGHRREQKKKKRFLHPKALARESSRPNPQVTPAEVCDELRSAKFWVKMPAGLRLLAGRDADPDAGHTDEPLTRHPDRCSTPNPEVGAHAGIRLQQTRAPHSAVGGVCRKQDASALVAAMEAGLSTKEAAAQSHLLGTNRPGTTHWTAGVPGFGWGGNACASISVALNPLLNTTVVAMGYGRWDEIARTAV